jgi:hypothetical protein
VGYPGMIGIARAGEIDPCRAHLRRHDAAGGIVGGALGPFILSPWRRNWSPVSTRSVEQIFSIVMT